jgi:hypothetical protein
MITSDEQHISKKLTLEMLQSMYHLALFEVVAVVVAIVVVPALVAPVPLVPEVVVPLLPSSAMHILLGTTVTSSGGGAVPHVSGHATTLSGN